MLLHKLNNRLLISTFTENVRKYSDITQTANEIQHIQYPPIFDLSYKAKKKRKSEKWHEEVRNLETVEEKIFKLNMPRYYGWKTVLINEDLIQYNSLPTAQYITRTHLVQEKGLPFSYYNQIISPDVLDALVLKIKSNFEDAITFEYINRKREQELSARDKANKKTIEDVTSNAIIKQITRALVVNLCSKYPHLMESEVDYEPRIEAFWCIGGIGPTARMKKAKSNMKWLKPYADDPVDRYIQYIGKPVAQLRHCLPLREIISLEESKSPAFEIPDHRYCPSLLGYLFERRHGTNIPGFWPGDSTGFGLLSFHNRGHFLERHSYLDDTSDALTTQAILASFSWLYTQACYQGFSTYNDLTYPLINQMVITNGQLWSFYVYQLNTTTMHSDCIDENNKRNICWSTEQLKLFDTIEDGKIHGFNDDVLKHLIRFYTNVPEERNVVMAPYLGKDVKVVADIEDPERRTWLEKRYKHLMSNRPRHRPMREILHWQKFYMIDHKTRPLEKKREPWEFNIDPTKRRLDEHHPMYVPKCLRPDPKKKKLNKWEKTYYP